jgi:aspartyl-tRNA(Asn)/glutamyl-tRNA(Gln) amidotransferase subunit B
MLGDFARLLHANDIDITEAKVAPAELYAMLLAVRYATITAAAAKTVFVQLCASDIVASVIERHPKAVADFHAGKQEALKFLVGQAMREAKGRADPNTLSEQIAKQLAGN